MKFGVITHAKNHRESNLGDDIQAIAAKQFLPRFDLYLEREQLNSYTENIFAILNGWYLHRPSSFPPSPFIHPFITSIHISPFIANKLLTNDVISYFRAHEPIGCRDLYTLELLQSKNVEVYFSSCLTLTLNKADFASQQAGEGTIILADPFFKYSHLGFQGWLESKRYKIFSQKQLLQPMINRSMRRWIKYKTHFLNQRRATFEQRERKARRLLSAYANARLVITSRLHAALPCLAFGTPVLFITENPNDARFSGNLEMLNVMTLNQIENLTEKGVFFINGEKVHWQDLKNPNGYKRYREKLQRIVAYRLEGLNLKD